MIGSDEVHSAKMSIATTMEAPIEENMVGAEVRVREGTVRKEGSCSTAVYLFLRFLERNQRVNLQMGEWRGRYGRVDQREGAGWRENR